MAQKSNQKVDSQIGPKTKGSLLFIFFHLMTVTYILLVSNGNAKLQLIVLLMTIISCYLLLIVTQDYFYLKSHLDCKKFRKDIRLVEPLLPERRKTDDAKTGV